MHKLSAFLVPLLLVILPVSGQNSPQPVKDSLTRKLIEHIILFPQEKIHLHTDREIYLSGETLWFRAWVTDAVLHTPVANQYITAELVNQAGAVVSRVRIKAINGAFHGYIALDQVLPAGGYTLTAYSEKMKESGPDYFFRKKIRVEGPMSATVTTETRFIFDGDEKITSEVIFRDTKTGAKIIPDRIRLSINGQTRNEATIDSDTLIRFSFRLPAASRQRTLTVETNRSSELFSVPYPPGDYEIGFYPEGGYLVENAPGLVAFTALCSDGSPATVSGRITDNAGNEYAQMETLHEGMGSFFIQPEPGVTLQAVCTDNHGREKTFPLPQPVQDACMLSVRTINDSLYISLRYSAAMPPHGSLILALHTRGMLHYAAEWDNSFATLAFDTGRFPSGVMQVLLLDSAFNPVSERLVFIRNNDQAAATLTTDREIYGRRQPVNASLKVTGPDGLPRGGSFSVSVTDDIAIEPDTSVSIMTSLLLNSDIRGYVRNPSFYFLKDSPVAKRAIDLLMLTNGWRRYDIPGIMKGNAPKTEIPQKTGMEITGRVRSLILGKPVAKAPVAAFSYPSGYYDETETDTDGRFTFRNIEFPDSTEFLIQALNRSGNDRVELVPDKEYFPAVLPVPATREPLSPKPDDVIELSDYITRADTKYTMENGMRTVFIEEVVITARAPAGKEDDHSFYMPKSENDYMTAKEIEELQPAFLSDVLRYLPHIEIVADSNGQKKAVIQRMSYALTGSQVNYAALIIDDIIIHDYDIDAFNPMDIERIGVLRGTRAIMMGSDAIGGAIVITTRKGSSTSADLPKNNLSIVRPLGYQPPAEFYSPRYDNAEKRNSGPPDLRTTIYWNPDVTLPQDGIGLFDLYTADSPSVYRVVIEGITSDGLIIHSCSRINRLQDNQLQMTSPGVSDKIESGR